MQNKFDSSYKWHQNQMADVLTDTATKPNTRKSHAALTDSFNIAIHL